MFCVFLLLSFSDVEMVRDFNMQNCSTATSKLLSICIYMINYRFHYMINNRVEVILVEIVINCSLPRLVIELT